MSTQLIETKYSDITTCYLSKLRDRSNLYRGETTDSVLLELIQLWRRHGERGTFTHRELQRLIDELQKHACLTRAVLTDEEICAAITKMDCLLRAWMRSARPN